MKKKYWELERWKLKKEHEKRNMKLKMEMNSEKSIETKNLNHYKFAIIFWSIRRYIFLFT